MPNMLIEISESALEPFRPYIYKEVYEDLRKKDFIALGLVEKGFSCGALIAGKTGPSIELLSLFIDRRMQGMGFGRAMLNELVKRGEAAGAAEIFAEYRQALDGSRLPESFFKGCGFVQTGVTSAEYAVTAGEGRKNKMFRGIKDYTVNENVVSFPELSQSQLSAIDGDGDIPEFLHYSCRSEVTRFDISKAYVLDGKVVGYVLIFQEDPESLTLGAAYSAEGHKGVFFPLFMAAAKDMDNEMKDSDLFKVTAVGNTSAGLVEAVIGKGRRVGETRRAVYRL